MEIASNTLRQLQMSETVPEERPTYEEELVEVLEGCFSLTPLRDDKHSQLSENIEL